MSESSKYGDGVFKQNIDFCGKEMLGDRAEQEDYSLFRTLSRSSDLLAVIADGMGGHAAGEVASREAVTAFDKTFVDYPSASIPTKLGAALQQANAELSKLIKANPSLNGMGCTLLAVHVSRAGLYWVSVGDSLLLLFRKGKISRLNADHSMTPVIQESVRQGKLTKQEAETHPSRNALRSAVMGEDLSLIDIPEKPFELLKGDVLLISSDGLLTLSDSKIADCVKKNFLAGADVIASALIQAVDQKKKPKQDNTTIQVISVPNFIGVSGAFSVKGYVIALCITLIFGLIGAYAFFTPSAGIGKLWSAVFDSGAKPVPVPISISPTPLSIPESASPSVSSTPSAPGLLGDSPQKAESENTKYKKNEGYENGSGKKIIGNSKKDPETKGSVKNPKSKESKTDTSDDGSSNGQKNMPSTIGDSEDKSKILEYFITPPAQSPSIKRPSPESEPGKQEG
jgi:PPM family protein phosphatase